LKCSNNLIQNNQINVHTTADVQEDNEIIHVPDEIQKNDDIKIVELDDININAVEIEVENKEIVEINTNKD